MTDFLNSREHDPCDASLLSESDDSGSVLLIGFLAMFLVLALLAFWPAVRQHIPVLADAARVQILGPVQRVTYVGGLSTHTQVEAGSAVVLVSGAVELERGVVVERRVSEVADQLCVVGTDRCHAIRSR